MIIVHTNRNSSDATVVTNVKTSITESPAYSSGTEVNNSGAVTSSAGAGTPPRLSRRKTDGALPSTARPKSMRPVENTPEFAEEAAEVITTKLTSDAAAASPAKENIVTNGDWPLANCRHGTTARIASSAAM